MRVSWEWLSELADLRGVTPRDGAGMLTMAGLTVESLEVLDLSEIVVGRVISQEPHPKSRNPLWIHQVDVGGETRQIIAGAPNAVAGSLVPVALPGTTVPNGRYVRDALIAGVAGQGMLCSREELLLGEDQEPAIMLLDAGDPGQRLSELIPPDAVLEVEVTPNRPDCLGHLGIARELAACAGRRLLVDFLPPFQGEADPPATELVAVRVEEPDLCRRYLAGVITDVSVGPSPAWMQRRLRAAGVRPINNLVDVTQYVMLEYGQPLHVFDLDRLGGRQIVVRRAGEGEALLTLDGVTRKLTADMLVIADVEVPVALAGVMGGEESAVDESTRHVVLEAATFDGVNVRATSRTLRLRTDASSRFEKKLAPELALAGARRAAQLIAQTAGGTVHRGWPDVYPDPQEPVRVTVDPARIDRILGVHVPLEEAEAILKRLDFGVRAGSDGTWDVLAPVWRLDVAIAEDLAEEIARIYGVERIPATLPGARRALIRPSEPSPERQIEPAREAFLAGGYDEAVTAALVPGRLLERLGVGGGAVRVINPISEEMDTLRTTLLPSLLMVHELNRNRGRGEVAVFETARAFRRREGGTGQPDEPWLLAAIGAAGAGGAEGRAAVLALKAVLDRAAFGLGVPPLEYLAATAPLFHPGRCAAVVAAGTTVGHVGELHPAVLRELDLPGRAAACEVDLDQLLAARRPRPAVELARFPSAGRDLNVVVDDAVPAAAVMATVRASAGGLLEKLRAFDEYRGAQVENGRKSLAFSLTFRSPERTLTDAEVDGLMNEVRRALEREQRASFRA